MFTDAAARVVTRRRALVLGGGAAGGLLASSSGFAAAASAQQAPRKRHGRLPAKQIQEIVGAEGSVSSGVLGISIERADIGLVRGPLGVVFTPSFEISGDLTFQPLGSNRAFFNGDLALKASELNPVIDAIHANGLVFQAMHQHYFDLDPMVWFIHFRGEAAPLTLAHRVRRVLDVTSTPLPQTMPSNPTTPLHHAKLAKTLHGSSEIGADGVVTVTVNRSDRIVIAGVQVSPEANISTNIAFLPLDAGGTTVAAAPDFSMTAAEVGPVCRAMRRVGFEIGCLYNQETAEHPQLYFAHMIATGDPQKLAVRMREALDHTHAD
ncbi:MAG: hypothetical protein QOK35_3795 [Pseudonocardiales bacterium]|jgi:hypothetical protein|nr:hypothetical protein [Pseudonocardiales bacterium]